MLPVVYGIFFFFFFFFCNPKYLFQRYKQKCVYIISLINIIFYSISFYNKCMEHSHRPRYVGCEN